MTKSEPGSNNVRAWCNVRHWLRKVTFSFLTNRIPTNVWTVFYPLLRIQLSREGRLFGTMFDGNAFVSRKGTFVVENWNGWPRSVPGNPGWDTFGISHYRGDSIYCYSLFPRLLFYTVANSLTKKNKFAISVIVMLVTILIIVYKKNLCAILFYFVIN